MGLPLVTMETNSYMGRQGASYLTKLDLADLIARDPVDYVETAIQLAANKVRLTALRSTLRHKVEAEIFDYAQHVQELETAYGHMVARQRSGLQPTAFSVRDNIISGSSDL